MHAAPRFNNLLDLLAVIAAIHHELLIMVRCIQCQLYELFTQWERLIDVIQDSLNEK